VIIISSFICPQHDHVIKQHKQQDKISRTARHQVTVLHKLMLSKKVSKDEQDKKYFRLWPI